MKANQAPFRRPNSLHPNQFELSTTMKLFLVIAVAALFASSASGHFFNLKKKPKFVDIHITKGAAAPGPGLVPVGSVPLFPYVPESHPLIDGSQYVPVNQVHVGHVQVSQVPANKISLGKVRALRLPVISQHSMQVVPIHIETPYVEPQQISVEPSVQAIRLLFKSASSPLLVNQQHVSSHGAIYQATQSQDNPHILRHVVNKPVLQEVREIIQPYRTITTQVQPVQERIHTILPVQKSRGPAYAGSSQVHFQDQYRNEYINGVIGIQQPEKGRPQPPVQQEPIEQEPIEQDLEQIDQHPVKSSI